MKRLRFTLTNYSSNRLRKGEDLILETRDKNSKDVKEFIVTIKQIVSDIPRCKACGIRLDNKQTYKYKTGQYCFDCYKRRIEKSKKL